MNEKKLSRRDFIRLSALSGAGAVLAACAQQTEPEESTTKEQLVGEPAAAEGKTVQYWVGWGGSYVGGAWDAMKATDEFKEYLGNNTLEIKGSVPEEGLLTAIAGGTPPDGAANYNYLDYMARDILQPVDDYVSASANIKKDNFIEANWKLGMYQGKLYGIPANECFMRFGTNYNKRMVEAAGLDPNNPPDTWSGWLEWHKALTKFDDAGNMKQIGLDPLDAMGESLWTSDGWMVPLSWGFDWFDENTGAFNLNNDQMVDYLETTKSFIDVIGIDNLPGMRQVEGQGTWGASFNAEVQAALIEGYWHPGETAVEKPEVLPYNMATWLPVPDSRKGAKVQGAGGHIVMIFKDAENKELMYKVTEFLNTNTACDILFKQVGWLPAIKRYLETVDTSAYPGLDFYFKSYQEATEFSSPEPCPITSFVGTVFGEVRERYLRDEISATDAAKELQTRCEDEYKAAGFGS
jgi:ABC-type glycerol-3-phosphate transport system substrate-binding protein